jgi:hypothetical protein
MINIKYKKIAGFIFSFVLFLPLLVSYGFIGSVDGNGNTVTINNPLGNNNTSVESLLIKIMNLVATVGAIVVVFFIIFSGYKFVVARGKPDAIEEAKKMFFATIIGGAILLGAGVIASVVVNTVTDTITN